MEKQSKKQETSLRRTAIAFVLAFAATITTLVSPARAAQDNDKRGFGMTTGVVGIVQNQTALLTLWNKGDEPVLARLQFVDDQGKVLIQCDAIIQPGKSGALEYVTFGGSLRTSLQAQFGTNAKRSIGLLVPTLQITDGTSHATQWVIGPEGFVEFRPLFNPPLVAPW